MRQHYELVCFVSVASWIFSRSHFSLSTFELDFLRRCTWRHPPTHGPESVTAAPTSSHSDRGSIRWALQLITTVTDQSRSVERRSRDGDVVCWASNALCEEAIGILLVFPGDLGGHEHSGPASIWDYTHQHRLDGASEVQRGAAFPCLIASTESRRPVGLFTSLAWVKSRRSLDGPNFTEWVDSSIMTPSARKMLLHVASHSVERHGWSRSIPFHFCHRIRQTFWSLCLDSLQKLMEDVHFWARGLSHTSSSVSLSLSPTLPVRLAVFFLWLVWVCLRSLRCVVSCVVHSLEISSRFCWLRICFGVLQTLEIRRLFSFLQSEASGLGLQRDAACWKRPGYGAIEFVYTLPVL